MGSIPVYGKIGPSLVTLVTLVPPGPPPLHILKNAVDRIRILNHS